MTVGSLLVIIGILASFALFSGTLAMVSRRSKTR